MPPQSWMAMAIDQQQIKEALVSLGYKLRDDGQAWRARAVYRNGNNDNSLIIYKDSGCWNDYGANLYSQPIRRLLELSGMKNISIEDIPDSTQPVNIVQDSQIEKIYPDSILSKLLPHYKFYNNRGITDDCLKRLKSGMATAGSMYQRYVFPIYNNNEKIIGFSGRYIGNNPEKNKIKWKHMGKKKNWVYPYYIRDERGQFFVKQAINDSKEVIIVESIGDLLALHKRGIFNVLVCFGLSCSPAIVCALVELNPNKIFLCLNNDYEKGNNNTGKIACIQNFLTLIKYFDYESIGICLPVKKDFGEMDDNDFAKWLEKKQSIDYDLQRTEICDMAENLKTEKRITAKSYKNLKGLNCE